MLINFKQIVKPLLRYLFPRKCVGCTKPDFWVCTDCLLQIPKSYENPFPWSFSIFQYKNKVIRKAIFLIKFNKKHSALEDLEQMIKIKFEEFLNKKSIDKKSVILIPIPITKRSYSKRGYNQSFLISKILSKNENINVLKNILVKSKNHLPQNKIKNRTERIDNVKNSFKIKNSKLVQNKIVVLIDDVTTTGATLEEARKILNKSGAKKVFAFTLAH